MKPTKGKQATLLPDRSAMNQLAKTGRTITDYAKSTPMTIGAATPAVVQNLRLKGK